MQETTPNPLKLHPLSERLCPSCRWAGPQNRTRPWGGHASFSGSTPRLSLMPPMASLYSVSCPVCAVGGQGLRPWPGMDTPPVCRPRPRCCHSHPVPAVHPCFWVATPHFPAPR